MNPSSQSKGRASEGAVLVPGFRVLSTDGEVGGTVKSEVNEFGNVLVHWDDGLRGWSQARLIERTFSARASSTTEEPTT